jgi:glycosyltransferase involved in cell wall biosynthesis
MRRHTYTTASDARFNLGRQTAKIIAAHAPYNEGGIGKLLAALVEDARSKGTLDCYFASATRANDALGCELSLRNLRWLFHLPIVRASISNRHLLASTLFDRAVAARLPLSQIFHGFAGSALYSFRRAREIGYEQLALESGTSHVNHVRQRHIAAHRSFPIERSWLNRVQHRVIMREYVEADEIWVPSEHARQSFLAAGVSPAKVRRRLLPVISRFAPPLSWEQHDGFRVVYVGRLEVTKGVPVLLEAFSQLNIRQASLTLVGGVASGSMERYIQRYLRADARIRMAPGDPLPHLHDADVLVHPSYEDGLALAPLEALACGVPVIVTEDTGMKEFVVPGHNGFIVPTGDVAVLTGQMEAIAARPLRGTFVPYSASDSA